MASMEAVSGLGLIRPVQGLAALQTALRPCGPATIGVVPVVWSRMLVFDHPTYFGLHGPCVSYDTACSAALSACEAGTREARRAVPWHYAAVPMPMLRCLSYFKAARCARTGAQQA
jgi:hypothetical protein